MAKQTFTTGQVLTAAQMTSLQQTAMGGGSATAKTASYILVSADAGTTVAMSAAGATTITVNTALFAAGDTVFIQNLGAGACTVTAGTATVATAGSLILPQNDAGILYFTATGASIFYDYIQAGAVSPLTTKGDLYTYSTSDARLAVGANTYTLVADSAEATGLKWAAPASGGGMTLINSGNTSLAGVQTLTISSISGSYKHLYIVGLGIRTTNSYGANLQMRVNGDTGSNYRTSRYQVVNSTIAGDASVNAVTSSWFLVEINNSTTFNELSWFEQNIPLYSDTTQIKRGTSFSGGTKTDVVQSQTSQSFNSTSAITSLTIFTSNSSTGDFAGDSAVYVYGVN